VRIANAQGQAMGVEDLLEELRKDPDLMPLFPSYAGAGAGVPAGGGAHTGGPGVVSAHDPKSFLANLSAIAKGEAKVTL